MSGAPVSDLAGMLAGMAPVMLDQHGWVFFKDDGDPIFGEPFAIINEAEGRTLVLPADPTDDPPFFARITLMVHSALGGVGLTAAVASALAEREIACNVVAGFHHDHLFVPWERREEALEILQHLAAAA